MRSGGRLLGRAAVVLLALGVLLMVVPPLVRDGICGITGCADQIPDIAVTRTADGLAILVPEQAASSVRSVRLLEGVRGGGSRRWVLRREGGEGSGDVTAFVAGQEVPGFRTTTPLEEQPTQGQYTAEVSFRCTVASLPFLPEQVAVGQVVSWSGATEGAAFSDSARISERCREPAGTAEKAMLALGALSATAGAVLGIIWVLRRPGRDVGDPWEDVTEPT